MTPQLEDRLRRQLGSQSAELSFTPEGPAAVGRRHRRRQQRNAAAGVVGAIVLVVASIGLVDRRSDTDPTEVRVTDDAVIDTQVDERPEDGPGVTDDAAQDDTEQTPRSEGIVTFRYDYEPAGTASAPAAGTSTGVEGVNFVGQEVLDGAVGGVNGRTFEGADAAAVLGEEFWLTDGQIITPDGLFSVAHPTDLATNSFPRTLILFHLADGDGWQTILAEGAFVQLESASADDITVAFDDGSGDRVTQVVPIS